MQRDFPWYGARRNSFGGIVPSQTEPQETTQWRARVARRPDQEVAQVQRRVHAAGTVQDTRREEGCHKGTRGRQPVHGREDDDQGEARLEEGAHPRPQEPQRDGGLSPAPSVIAFEGERGGWSAPFAFPPLFSRFPPPARRASRPAGP